MATEVKPTVPPPEAGTGLIPYRLNVEQFLKMIVAGVFPDEARVELIRGRLIKRMTKYTPHNFAVDALAERLRLLVAPGHRVREEKSVEISPHSRPEPDIAVARGPRDAYRTRDPQAENLALVVEVSDSTYRKDRGPMWGLYAEAGVPVYWIVNVAKRQIEVYSDPAGKGRAAEYRQSATYGQGAEAPVVIDGVEVGKVAVNEILP